MAGRIRESQTRSPFAAESSVNAATTPGKEKFFGFARADYRRGGAQWWVKSINSYHRFRAERTRQGGVFMACMLKPVVP